MSELAYEALPMSRRDLRTLAQELRDVTGFGAVAYVDVERLLDHRLPSVWPQFTYEVCEPDEMARNHGLAFPERAHVRLRSDVFEGMCNGLGRDRLTVVHEIAHAIVHTPDRLVLRRGYGKPRSYRDPEWQASCLAGEFLVSHKFIHRGMTVQDISDTFGVSYEAAQYQLVQYTREGLLL